MAKYVPDIKTKRWVIIAPGRTKRPHQTQNKPQEQVCPFCPGNEHETPPEVYRIGEGEKDKPGWLVRVTPNKYPITDIHEVIIHSPDHEKDIEDLPAEQVQRIFTAYRDRYRAYEQDGQVMIFCNHGVFAGSSLTHPHSQMVVVPNQINFDALSREPVTNTVAEIGNFTLYCPDFSQWPFEMWITPHEHIGSFTDSSNDDLNVLAGLVQRSLKALQGLHQDQTLPQIHHQAPFGYNYYISHGPRWFVRIIPRFIHRAGFELGTGLSVNTVDPAEAAELLRGKL